MAPTIASFLFADIGSGGGAAKTEISFFFGSCCCAVAGTGAGVAAGRAGGSGRAGFGGSVRWTASVGGFSGGRYPGGSFVPDIYRKRITRCRPARQRPT